MTEPIKADAKFAAVLLEGCEWPDIGVAPESDKLPELVAWCMAAVGLIAVDSDRVRLVITGDFVQSVRDRTLSEYYRENYDTERSTGTVGGKTMTLADGSVDVLLHASGFRRPESEDDRAEREELIRRTTVHEANHVAMEQAGEGALSYNTQTWARQNILGSADSVISEYRAELGVAEFAPFPYQGWDFLEILQDFQIRLKSVDEAYQESLDVGALSMSVGTQATIVWRVFAYLAAYLRKAEGGFNDLPSEWTDEPIWQRIVGNHWATFTAILEPIPSGSHRIERSELDRSIDALASELQAWLATIGFSFVDTAEGPRFNILSRGLLD